MRNPWLLGILGTILLGMFLDNVLNILITGMVLGR